MPQTVPIFCDNQGATALAEQPVFRQCTKHIKLKYPVIRAYIKDNTIHLFYIHYNDNLADMLTKTLNGNKMQSFTTKVHGKMDLIKTCI